MKRTWRMVYGLVMLVIGGFGVFGFMATFEPTTLDMTPWRIGYAALTVAALALAIWLLWPRKRHG